jgi:hypothetical protein
MLKMMIVLDGKQSSSNQQGKQKNFLKNDSKLIGKEGNYTKLKLKPKTIIEIEIPN